MLAVILSKQNEIVQKVFYKWIELAKHGNYKRLISELGKIVCPTLVIGGGCDKIVGVASSFELAKKISNSELFIYKAYGHATYEEARDFNERIFDFLMR